MPQPPDQQRPKPPSRPELPIGVDRVVGAAGDYASSLDHVRPELERKRTLPGIQATKPPEARPTRRVPSPWGQTVLKPPPPSSVALARRSEPPVVAPSDVPVSEPPAASLPPPSLHPDEASAAASRRRAIKAEERADTAETKLRELELLLAIEQEKSKQATAPAKPWIDERLVKALVAVLTALAALGAPMGIWLTVQAAATENALKKLPEAAKEANATASSAKAESRDVAKELDELKKQLAAERAYNREVLRKMGVQVPKRKDDPESPTLETATPQRKPGSVTPAPVLVVTTPPP